MDDLAERVDDMICVYNGTSDTTMDTLAMLIFGWVLAALFLLWLGKFLYMHFALREKSGEFNKITTPITSGKIQTEHPIDVTDTRSVNKVSPVKVFGGEKRGGYVPPTPPVRKRITRQSPGPDLRKTRFIPSPQCTGADNVCVLWVNDVFQWLYSDLVIVNELLNAWIVQLNEYSNKSVTEGVGIEFVRILPETHPPSLTNLFAECDSKDDVTITCDCESTPAFQLKCFRQKSEKVETSHYRVNVNRFRARLNIFCVSEKLQANVKCDGWPEIKIALAPVGNIKNNLDETQLQEVISEIVTNALRSTSVDLNLAQYPTCPRLIRHIATPGHSLPLHYDSMLANLTSTPNRSTPASLQSADKRLLVKIIRAAGLGLSQGCTDPFCVVEMDEPSQRNQTSVQKNTNSPSWDEHFLFDLSSSTAELLFEIYDHAAKPHKFLGLAIVGIEELLINPAQRQTISLQSRPYESDPVSGTITVEFLFIEAADIPNIGDSKPYKIKESIKSFSPISKPTLTTPASTYVNDTFSNEEHFTLPSHNDISGNTSLLNGARNNTLVIHSLQKQPSQRLVKVELSSNGKWKEVERIETEVDNRPIDLNDISNGKVENESTTVAEKPGDYTNLTTSIPQHSTDGEAEFRSRPRKRRDFFGTIKRRLNKSKGRSRSVGSRDNDDRREDSLNRSVSADRNRNDDSIRLNIPREETSRRSSLSEASGLSSASTRTYVNEASTLVLETSENGVKKHYLVPLSLAQKSKWRKKGVKLHIFNDHTFVARHLPGGTVCRVCEKTLARRIGKQGYECRDCLLKCHKHCHVKVNDNCPTSTIHMIELTYITNPFTDKKSVRML